MASLEISLPWPHPELMPNKMKARAFKNKQFITREATRDERSLAKSIAKSQTGPRMEGQLKFTGPVHLEMVFFRRKRPGRAPDLDNLVAAMKPYLDGLTDAEIWSDDGQIEHIDPVLLEGNTDYVYLTVSAVEGEGEDE